MFRKILLPVDLTDKHQKALATAADLARQGHGEVVLLHLIEVIPGLGPEEEKDFYERLERKARTHLDRLAAFFNQKQVPCRSEILFGQRAADTVHWAAGHQIDLIVLTSPPFQPDHPASTLGSMTWKISMVASCPVLLVKG